MFRGSLLSLFFSPGRLLVDRPGHYTVRMTVLLYHEDEKRRDGVHLELEDLLKVSHSISHESLALPDIRLLALTL